jgi:thioredoxin reductase (NADPH)
MAADVVHDIIIVGAGPAGLSAALYAARFLRSTLVIHDGTPRAAQIPLTRNLPGHEAGIGGVDLMARMTRQAEACGAVIVQAKVTAAHRRDDGMFVLTADDGASWTARALILATGVAQNQPPLPEDVHQAAVDAGVLRYCPICDGFEHRGERIAVLGCDVSGAAEALFLKGYSDSVTLIPRRHVALTSEERRDLETAGVRVLTEAVTRYAPNDRQMIVHLESGASFACDVLYPALGSQPRNDLARMLGIDTSETGTAPETAHLGTAVPGLWCAGDLVEGLDQISVAMGHGAFAATRAHNWLREGEGETVEAVLDHGGAGVRG